ncbi:MAG TPA: tetrahydrofolate dehydrogenase/cyclohydrolase catalytic domain-containing protein [Thermoanaerobaculia bacterium]|nr:tetrahydrofolate dehydrogenase/cyclohydrolase catalytic domain-containing protein [Thermoanaerobaculia bacterium]
MPAQIIDGKAVAQQVEAEVRDELQRLGYTPNLVVIRVGNDPASEVYVRNKARKAKELGLRGTELVFDASMREPDLLGQIARLNGDPDVDGILVQLPLPKQIDSKKVIEAIDPRKDVDGFHPMNVGLLHLGQPSLVPCTPAGILRLIRATGAGIEGARAGVIGRSDIVGKPVAALLLRENATVTICHSKTRDLAAVAREADILVAAIGRPRFVTAAMVKPGAVVIDVGINRVEGKLTGDVDFQNVREIASWITPVPGGVGPMTIAMLMRNTVIAAKERR